VAEAPDDGKTPLWGWVLIIAAATMLVALVVVSLSSGGSPGR
jgi:hypothetical protein